MEHRSWTREDSGIALAGSVRVFPRAFRSERIVSLGIVQRVLLDVLTVSIVTAATFVMLVLAGRISLPFSATGVITCRSCQ